MGANSKCLNILRPIYQPERLFIKLICLIQVIFWIWHFSQHEELQKSDFSQCGGSQRIALQSRVWRGSKYRPSQINAPRADPSCPSPRYVCLPCFAYSTTQLCFLTLCLPCHFYITLLVSSSWNHKHHEQMNLCQDFEQMNLCQKSWSCSAVTALPVRHWAFCLGLTLEGIYYWLVTGIAKRRVCHWCTEHTALLAVETRTSTLCLSFVLRRETLSRHHKPGSKTK